MSDSINGVFFNYLAMRYPAISARVAGEFGWDSALTGIEVIPSVSARNVPKVVFSYSNRNLDFTEKFFMRTAVTDKFHSWSARM